MILRRPRSGTIPDAAEIVAMPLDDARGWMEVGELEGVCTID